MPKVIAVSNINHGYVDDDGKLVMTDFKVGDELPNDLFSDEEFQALITCQSAVDTSGELQVLVAVPFVDEVTAERDKLLRQAGLPTLVDTSNPTNRQVPDQQTVAARTLEEENERLRKELADAKASQESTKGSAPKPVSTTPVSKK